MVRQQSAALGLKDVRLERGCHGAAHCNIVALAKRIRRSVLQQKQYVRASHALRLFELGRQRGFAAVRRNLGGTQRSARICASFDEMLLEFKSQTIGNSVWNIAALDRRAHPVCRRAARRSTRRAHRNVGEPPHMTKLGITIGGNGLPTGDSTGKMKQVF